MWHPKTLSFWLSWLGMAAIAFRRTRTVGAVALFAVSWGALGGIYFRTAERHMTPVQPAYIFPRLTRDDYRSAIKHGLFMVPAIWAIRCRNS